MKINDVKPGIQSGNLTISYKGSPRGQFNFNGTKIFIEIEDPAIRNLLETVLKATGNIKVKVRILAGETSGKTIKLITPKEEIIKQALKIQHLPGEARTLFELMAKEGKLLTREIWEKFIELKRSIPQLEEETFLEAIRKGIPLKKPLLEAMHYVRHPDARRAGLENAGVESFKDPGFFYEKRIADGKLNGLKESFKASQMDKAPLIDSYHIESQEGIKKVLVNGYGRSVEVSFTEEAAYFEVNLENSGKCKVLVTKEKVKIWFESSVYDVWKSEIDGKEVAGRKVEVHLG